MCDMETRAIAQDKIGHGKCSGELTVTFENLSGKKMDIYIASMGSHRSQKTKLKFLFYGLGLLFRPRRTPLHHCRLHALCAQF